jgi:prepilin-type N-terminal cleavage/methylation domain-containing protein
MTIAKYKIQNTSVGFTLIELLVTMAIIGILAATAMVNFGKNDDRDARQEKERLTSFLREVQNKALVGEKISTASGKICGFGVYYDSGNLQTFYASEPDVDAPCSPAASNTDLTGEQFVPRNGVSIAEFSEEIFFEVPTGNVYIGGSRPTDVFTISMSSSVSVTIAPGGAIK